MSASSLTDFLRTCQNNAFFGAGPIAVARAPGRLDVMGGIADYSGSLVLERTIKESAHVAVQPQSLKENGDIHAREAASISVRSGSLSFNCSWQDIETVSRAGQFFTEHNRWAAYLLGCVALLAERNKLQPQSLKIWLESKVPIGKGVSSSAAIEVACMRALSTLWGIELEGPELARACQRVENEVVGAPCGLMDQMTSVCGQQDQLLCLLCQPDQIKGHSSLPEYYRLWGIDSGVRHSVGGADYGSVRCAAFMGQKICLSLLQEEKIQSVKSYLVNIGAERWAELRSQIPQHLTGREFIEQFGSTLDVVADVNPDQSYQPRVCAEHPIMEHQRVKSFVGLLQQAANANNAAALGRLMVAAHNSYSSCGLGSAGTDFIVNRVEKLQGQGAPLFGAKISGGGSGGTVVVLSDNSSQAEDCIAQLALDHSAQFEGGGYLFQGSSEGAMQTPAIIGERQ